MGSGKLETGKVGKVESGTKMAGETSGKNASTGRQGEVDRIGNAVSNTLVR